MVGPQVKTRVPIQFKADRLLNVHLTARPPNNVLKNGTGTSRLPSFAMLTALCSEPVPFFNGLLGVRPIAENRFLLAWYRAAQKGVGV